MIVIDSPQRYPAIIAGKRNPYPNRKWAHLMSTLTGTLGHNELMAFARVLGLSPMWLQHANTYKEHFDVTERYYNAAITKGAIPIATQDIAALIDSKRNGVDYSPLGGGAPGSQSGSATGHVSD